MTHHFASAEPAGVFHEVATELNGLARLEQVRSVCSVEEYDALLAGVGSVLAASGRLLGSMSGNLAAMPSGDRAGTAWSETARSVAAMAEQLAELTATTTQLRQQLHEVPDVASRPPEGVGVAHGHRTAP